MTERNILFYETNGYNPIGAGWKKYAGGEKTEQVVSGYYTLYYVLSGTGTYGVNHIDYHAAAGDMIVCAPSDSFYCRVNAEDPAEHVWITFTICGKVFNRISVSRFRLVRAFAKVKNMPPMEFVIRCRLERACELIRSRRYSLSEVSQMTGYKNYSTFARVFKKYCDITPKEYRKKFLHEMTQGNI